MLFTKWFVLTFEGIVSIIFIYFYFEYSTDFLSKNYRPSTTMHTPSECKVNTINEKAGVQNKKLVTMF